MYVSSWDHVYYSNKPFFPYISSTKQHYRLNHQIEGKPSPNPIPKVVRTRLEKVTYLCTQSDYYVVVSRSQTTFARRKAV